KNVGTVAFVGFLAAIMPEDRVEIAAVAPEISGDIAYLSHSPGKMNDRFVETLVPRTGGVIVAKVPFPESACGIAGIFQHFAKGDFPGSHGGPAVIGVPDTGAQRVTSGHQAGPRGSADGRHIEVREPHAFAGKTVDVRRFHMGIAVKAEV